MKGRLDILRTVIVLGQLGFDLVVPPVGMGLLGWWLQSRFGLGLWVMVLCLLAGLLAAGANGFRFYRRLMGREKQPKERPVNFRRHE